MRRSLMPSSEAAMLATPAGAGTHRHSQRCELDPASSLPAMQALAERPPSSALAMLQVINQARHRRNWRYSSEGNAT